MLTKSFRDSGRKHRPRTDHPKSWRYNSDLRQVHLTLRNRLSAANSYTPYTMLPARLTRSCLRSSSTTATRAFTTFRPLLADNPIPANDTKDRSTPSPVSSTNATPTSSEGNMDKPLQESVAEGEERRSMQAPNRQGVWSRSQQAREKAMVGPRFEQMIMYDQVRIILPSRFLQKRQARQKIARGGIEAQMEKEQRKKRRYKSKKQFADVETQHSLALWQPSSSSTNNPSHLYQRRQTSNMRLHLLWSPLREFFCFVSRPLFLHFSDFVAKKAKESNRKYLESLPSTPYPLKPTGDEAEVPMGYQSNTGKPLEQR
jgi:hypothetical protein